MAFTSLLASCRMHDVEPWSYLRDLLCLLPDWPAHRLLELSPLHWTATAQLPEVQRALHDNVYRLTLLGAPAAGGWQQPAPLSATRFAERIPSLPCRG
ncbi:MAG: transposase domain-containing protein [Polyangiaceae bacterium]